MKFNKRLSLLSIIFSSIFFSALADDGGVGKGTALIEAENQVTVKHGAKAWEKPPSLPAPLAVGDRVQTGELSRAAVRLTDMSVLRLDELTNIEIVPPPNESGKSGLDISS